MNAVSGIFIALSLILSGGYILNKIYVATQLAAIERIQRGMPPLSRFTNRLTCSTISNDGKLVRQKCSLPKKTEAQSKPRGGS